MNIMTTIVLLVFQHKLEVLGDVICGKNEIIEKFSNID